MTGDWRDWNGWPRTGLVLMATTTIGAVLWRMAVRGLAPDWNDAIGLAVATAYLWLARRV